MLDVTGYAAILNPLQQKEGEITGRIQGSFVVDLAGDPIWEIRGDGLYQPGSDRAKGYLGSPAGDDL